MAGAMIGCALLRGMVLLCCQFCDDKTSCEWVAQAVADAGKQEIGELLQPALRRGREARGVCWLDGCLQGQKKHTSWGSAVASQAQIASAQPGPCSVLSTMGDGGWGMARSRELNPALDTAAQIKRRPFSGLLDRSVMAVGEQEQDSSSVSGALASEFPRASRPGSASCAGKTLRTMPIRSSSVFQMPKVEDLQKLQGDSGPFRAAQR
ncbi:hypothetical protein B0J14DRAFT_558864 [Halenospora varia]|nr:hypothetical protein B0J14DRAFT_558864 [Halenospora varia]